MIKGTIIDLEFTDETRDGEVQDIIKLKLRQTYLDENKYNGFNARSDRQANIIILDSRLTTLEEEDRVYLAMKYPELFGEKK